MRKIEVGGKYINATNAKDGEVCKITGRIEISEMTSPEGKTKSVLNIPVGERVYTPNKTTIQDFTKAWGDDIDKWEGKGFKIKVVKDEKNKKFPIKVYGEPMQEDVKGVEEQSTAKGNVEVVKI